MKKKLTLTDVTVASFVTRIDANKIKGGATKDCLDELITGFSCLHNLSCNPIAC